jgi:hypothetical protein
MRFWIREIAGWLLVGLGLFIFYTCFALLLTDRPPRIFETGPLTFIGFVVFRGGIHLLKVAVAARVCLQAREPQRPISKPHASTGRDRLGASRFRVP